MTLHPAGCEFYTWPAVADVDPIPAIEVSIDNGTTWHETEAVDGGFRALIAGPAAEPEEGALVVPLGVTTFIARAVDNPEVIIRGGGSIRCG